MFGIPLWVIGIVIQVLEKLGLFSGAEKLAVRAGIQVVKAAENAKVEYTYPTGRNGLTVKHTYARGPANGNFNQGDGDAASNM